MHYYHLYLVKADDIESVKNQVDSVLDGYGDSRVYDYYNVEKIHSKHPSGVFRIKGNEAEAWLLIQRKIASMDANLSSYKKSLIEYFKTAKITSFDQLKRNEMNQGMIGHILYNIGKSIAGYFSSECYFYDWIEGDPNISKQKFDEYAEQEDIYLVEVDLHN